MNRKEALDFVDNVFYGMNTLTKKLSKMANVQTYDTLYKLDEDYEEVRRYLRDNLR